MTKIKIAYFIDAYKPGAGTENQLRGILRNLDPDRFEATLFTLRDEVAAKHRRELPWPVECLRVGKLASLNSIKKFFTLVSRLRREKYDIALTYFYDTNLFVIPACFLAGIKNRVVNRRNVGYSVSPKLQRWLDRVNKFADYFLVNSRVVKEQTVLQEHFPSERICVIYNGLFDLDAHGPIVLSKNEINLPKNAQVVGMVANLRRVKRVDRFIEMARRVTDSLPDTHFLIIGEGDLEPDLRRQVEKESLTDRAHFLGQVPNAFAYLPLFDVGVLTSESEGLSNSLIEYAYAGVPAVAFDVGGNREVVETETTGIIVPEGKTHELADAVIQLLKNTELREKFSSAARARAGELFDSKSAISRNMAFYESIVGSARRSCRFD